jgi:C4-dicarboxylate-specific signal transduction histidine kinase
MEFVLEQTEAATDAVVKANPSAVEQILFNLVDNACKYAAASSDKRIHLDAALGNGDVELSIRDHGPGLSQDASRKLFRPFSKSAREAAHSAPGVGLGLALSRRLARDMGGRLEADRAPAGGACFRLRLPTV